jgi:hypothetical protein
MLSRFTRKQASSKAKSVNQEINETKSGLFGSTYYGLFKNSIIFLWSLSEDYDKPIFFFLRCVIYVTLISCFCKANLDAVKASDSNCFSSMKLC